MDHASTEWESLAAAAGTFPTQDLPWTEACAEAFRGVAAPVEVGDEGGLTAVAPLVRRAALLEMPGGPQLGEPSDLLAAGPDALEELAGRLVAGSTLDLARVPADSPTIAALRRAAGNRATVHVVPDLAAPTIALDERWQEPGGGLSSSRRSALRRGRRKAEKVGELSFDLAPPAPERVADLLDEAFTLEARSWKGAAGTTVDASPRLRSFFDAYAALLAERGQLRLEMMRLDGVAIAMQLGLVWNRRHWLLKIGFDESVAHYSPGLVLLAESTAAAAREGFESYELMGTRSGWTDVWTEEVHECSRAIVIPHHPRSLGGAASLAGQRLAREAMRNVRKGSKAIAVKAAESYVAADLEDALVEERRYAAAGYETTVGYWNPSFEPHVAVVAKSRELTEGLAAGSEVSIKLASMGGDGEPLDELLAICGERGLTLHIDALGPDSADEALATARRLAAIAPGRIGCTLPGRWTRSLADAAELRDSGLRIRIVKGEIADEPDREQPLAAGFAAVARALAGGSCHVEAATQNAPLAREVLGTLGAAGTSRELQVLHGMASDSAVAVARELGDPVRVYVPYGHGRVPFGKSQLGREPRLLLTLGRDLSSAPPRRAPGA